MRVLVTGASGFLGGFAARELRARGHEVTALVRRPGSAPPECDEAHADLAGGASTLAAAVSAARPDCVLHLAAEIATQRDAARIAAVNVAGTARLLEACRAAGSPKVVFASTVVTGDAHGALLDEDTALPVETAYGRSKQEGERLLRSSGPIRLADFVATIATALGIGSPRHVPAWLARLAAGREPVAAMTRSARSSNARIKRELDWSPQYPTAADGVPAAVAELAAQSSRSTA